MPRRNFALLFAVLPLLAWLVLESILFARRERYGPYGRPVLVLDRGLNASLLSGFGEIRSENPGGLVPLEAMPAYLPRAVLYQEDQAFYEHNGYHLREMARAAYEYIWLGRLRGASTITQQLARTMFLSREKSARRKLFEVRVARILEQSLGKDRILELYLNRVYWGKNQYGIAAAARLYFGKSPLVLTREEVAYLVSILPNPDACGRLLVCSTPRLSRRQERINRFLLRGK